MLKRQNTDYKKDLGLIEAISIVVGRIIGSGIFRTPAPIMMLSGCTMIFGIVWVIGGIVTIFAAICFAELSAMLPKSGGPYVYLKMAYPPVWTFLRGWAMFFVSETASIVAVALVFSEYLCALIEQIYSVTLPKLSYSFISFAIVWFLTSINLFGVKLSGKFQNIFSFVKVLSIFGIIFLAFSNNGDFMNFYSPFFPKEFSFKTVIAIGAGMRYAFFAFSGWEGATYVAEEVRKPEKNLPLSLLFGIGAVMLLYAGINGAYLYQLPVETLQHSKQVAVDTLTKAIGISGGIFIAIAVMISTFGNLSAQVLVKARSWHAMARDGLFFSKLSSTHHKFKTPNNALILQAIWATVLLIFASFAENSYESMIDFFTATSTIFNILVFVSLFILRKKYPNMNRPYKAWFYPYSVIIIILIYFVLLIITIIDVPVESLIGFALTATGLIYYYMVVKKREIIDS